MYSIYITHELFMTIIRHIHHEMSLYHIDFIVIYDLKFSYIFWSLGDLYTGVAITSK